MTDQQLAKKIIELAGSAESSFVYTDFDRYRVCIFASSCLLVNIP